MTIKPPHNRRLGICGVSLTKQKANKHDMQCMIESQNVIEKILLDSDFYKGAPFYWITVAIRYGIKNEEVPVYSKINKKFGDLPLAIEINVNGKRHAPYEEIYLDHQIALLKALIHAGNKYNLPTLALEDALSNLLPKVTKS